MTRDYEDQPDSPDEQQPEYDANPFDRAKRQQPPFNDFEEDEEIPYEEPDRDTNYTSGFREDDEFDDYLPEDELEDVDLPDPGMSAGLEPESTATWQQPQKAAAEPTETWFKDEEYPAERAPIDGQPWPLGLIAVGALALLLLVAGGYGVIQQRSATQEEIRQLQAALATTASPEDVNASRVAVRELKRENARLASQTDALRTENRRLIDTVAGLEAQLDTQRAAKNGAASKPAVAAARAKTPEPATAKPVAPTPPPKATKPATVVAQTPVSSSGVTWFVNFGSYGQRTAAETWKSKLQPGSGKVIIAPSSKDGRTFYRVRVIDLASRESADKVARGLEQDHGVSKLWVGKQ